MEIKTKIIIVTVALAASFAAGRYSVPTTVKIETKTTTEENKTEEKKKNTKKRKRTQVIKNETKKPDGTTITTTVINTDTNTDTNTDAKTNDITHTVADTKSETTKSTNVLNISAIAGVDILTGKPTYGAAITKPLIGPVTISAFGLINGVIGGGIGLNF